MIETAASRARMLDDAILSHGKEKMDPGQLGTWNDIVMQASLIPFNEVFAQFDPASQSF